MRLRIAELCKTRGIENPNQLAQHCFLAPATAARLWRGAQDAISLDIVARLCEGLNCQPGDLFDGYPVSPTFNQVALNAVGTDPRRCAIAVKDEQGNEHLLLAEIVSIECLGHDNDTSQLPLFELIQEQK